MAKNESRMRDLTTQESELDKGLNIKQEEAKRAQQQQQMDKKIREMTKTTLEFYEKYGEEDYRYQMMVTFLDVAFQMKDAIALLTSVRVATSYLSTALEFIDDTVTFNEEFDQQMLSKSYGPFANLKRRFRTWRAMRNNRRRMTTVISTITDRLETAHVITDSLRAGFEKMRLTMYRTDEKRRKKEAKRAAKSGAPAPSSQPSAAELYIRQMAQEKGLRQGGGAGAGDTVGGGSTTGGSTTGGSGSTDRGIDDIV
ncbi:MAG: hypothetical protein ACI4VK_04520 [Candidatus Coproplasma sp.]